MPNPGIDRERITPQYLQRLSDPLEAIYQSIAHDLMVMLAKMFGEGRSNTESFAWRSAMLAKIGFLRRSSIALIASYSKDVSKAVKDAIEDAILQGIEWSEPDLAKAYGTPDYVPSVDETIHRVMQTYYDQAINKCNMVNTVMLNSTLEYYQCEVGLTADQMEDLKRRLAYDQEELNAEAGAVIIGAKSLQQATRDAVLRMSEHGTTGFYDKAGRAWDADAYVQMDLRTTAANSAREAAFQRNKDYGNNLIHVSAHAGAREGCYPYQGGVYSTDGSTGEAEDLNGNKIPYSPLESTSYGTPAGLFGINCRHQNYPFISGYTVLRKQDNGLPMGAEDLKENREHYKLNQMQRRYERDIRKLKQNADMLDAAGFKNDAEKARQAASDKNRALQEWCDANGQDYYPERTRFTRTR